MSAELRFEILKLALEYYSGAGWEVAQSVAREMVALVEGAPIADEPDTRAVVRTPAQAVPAPPPAATADRPPRQARKVEWTEEKRERQRQFMARVHERRRQWLALGNKGHPPKGWEPPTPVSAPMPPAAEPVETLPVEAAPAPRVGTAPPQKFAPPPWAPPEPDPARADEERQIAEFAEKNGVKRVLSLEQAAEYPRQKGRRATLIEKDRVRGENKDWISPAPEIWIDGAKSNAKSLFDAVNGYRLAAGQPPVQPPQAGA